MNTEQISPEGVKQITLPSFHDHRGTFLKLFDASVFAEYWGDNTIRQINYSINPTRGTLRGMHYQRGTEAEMKIVRCMHGAIYDVVLDLRPDSASFGRFAGFRLTAGDNRALLVPAGCAHGFQTLEDHTEVLYLHSGEYSPGQEAGINAGDPELGIPWPLPVTEISARDLELPRFRSKDFKK